MNDNGKEKETLAEDSTAKQSGEAIPPKTPTPPTDFKVAEIWIKNGQVFLEASQEFWMDRCRALGLLEFCKEIVKTAKVPSEEKPNIIVPKNGSPLNFLRNRLKGKK